MKQYVQRLILAAFAVTLAACSGESTPSGTAADEAFLEEVRQNAATAPPSGVGIIAPGENAPMPQIEIPVERYELGVVPNNTQTKQLMKVFNRGTGVLKISRVSTSCGCTTGEMRTSEIPPGGEGILEITFDPFKVTGFDATRFLTIHSNDPRRPHLEFPVTAYIEREFEMEPAALDFTQIDGGGAEGSVRIRQIQKAAFTLGKATAQSTGPLPEVTVIRLPEAEWEKAGQAEWSVAAKFAEGTAAGQYAGNIVLETDLPRFKTITIPYRIRLAGPYSIEPQEVTLRDVETGELQKAAIVISSKDPLEIVSLANENERVTYAHRIDAERGEAIIDLTLAEAGPSRLQSDNLTIVFKRNGQEHTETVRVLVLQPRN